MVGTSSSIKPEAGVSIVASCSQPTDTVGSVPRVRALSAISELHRWGSLVPWRHVPVVLIVLCCVHAEAALRVSTSYQYPLGMVRVCVYNCGEDPVDLQRCEILKAGGGPIEPLWMVCEPPSLAVGGFGILGYKMKEPLQGGQAEHVIRVDNSDTRYSVNLEPPLAITYAVRCEQEDKLYLYVQNLLSKDLSISGAMIDDVPMELSSKEVFVSSNRKSVVCGRWSSSTAPVFDVPWVRVSLTVNGMPLEPLLARVFRPEHTLMQHLQSPSETVECLTHTYPDAGTAAKGALSASASTPGKMHTIKFCNIDLRAKGPQIFAQLMERNHIEPQLSYANECYSTHYVPVLLDAVETTKAATEPGITYCFVLPSDIHNESRPAFSVARLRTMIYAMLAGGSKGFELFPPKFEEPNGIVAQANNRLLAELSLLRDLIAISEPVTLLVSSSPEGVQVRTLLCGDEGILLFVFQDETDGTDSSSIHMELAQPYPLAGEALGVDGASTQVLSQDKGSRVALDVPRGPAAQVYYLQSAQRSTGG